MNHRTASFPANYADLETAALLGAYEAGPARLKRALDGLSDEALGVRPIGGKWSVLEITLHMADSEIVGAARMRMVLAGDEPLLPAFDQDRWSPDLRYRRGAGGRLVSALQLFTSLREATLPLLTGAAPEDWFRTGMHPELGPVTLRNLLELYADHSERHITQILERRDLLGSPLELPCWSNACAEEVARGTHRSEEGREFAVPQVAGRRGPHGLSPSVRSAPSNLEAG